MDTLGLPLEHEPKVLQNGASSEQAVDALVAHVDPYQAEPPEIGKGVGGERKVVGDLPVGQEEGLERAATEYVGREGRQGGPGLGLVVQEGEVLGELGGEEARPLGELEIQGGGPAA